jgi:hypothetical protein
MPMVAVELITDEPTVRVHPYEAKCAIGVELANQFLDEMTRVDKPYLLGWKLRAIIEGQGRGVFAGFLPSHC